MRLIQYITRFNCHQAFLITLCGKLRRQHVLCIRIVHRVLVKSAIKNLSLNHCCIECYFNNIGVWLYFCHHFCTWRAKMPPKNWIVRYIATGYRPLLQKLNPFGVRFNCTPKIPYCHHFWMPKKTKYDFIYNGLQKLHPFGLLADDIEN